MIRILLIEDDPVLQEATAEFLRSEGFSVETASDGARGLELASERYFDLILTDFVLPLLNGIEVCRRLRERGIKTPAIILTGEKREEIDKVLGLELGADDYLIKPVGQRELLARIHVVLRRERSEREGTRASLRGGRECPRCRFENPPDTRFCGGCGTSLITLSPAPPSGTETLTMSVRELTTGSTFAGRYQVIEELGRGGMGRVYKAFDTNIREKIALKLISPEIASHEDTIERFRREIRLARRIGHRNVCRMFDIGEADGAHFITMEYVHGEDLKSMIEMSGSLSMAMLLSVGKQVADGLAEAHSLGVIHRDLKPQNIMIDKHGNAKIMDFGIARSVREKGTTGPSVAVGTPEYMSPEQVEAKDVDHRSDIYSLGIVLYEMATSRVPFTGETALGIAMKHKGEVPKSPKELNPELADDLCAVILKCLEKDPAKRYQGASDVRSDLEKIERDRRSTSRSA